MKVSFLSEKTKSVAICLRLPPGLADIVKVSARFCNCSDPEMVRRMIERYAQSINDNKSAS